MSCDLGIEPQRHLVERAQKGDSAAWLALYEHAYPSLLAYARRNGGFDVAEDLVNETMARAVAGIGRFRWRSVAFEAWLFGILRRVCADHHRSRARQRKEPKREDVDFEAVEEGLLRDEEHVRLRRAFGRLKPADRELLELRVIAGLSVEDVARTLGRRAGAIRMAQSRALSQLRKLLEEGE